MPQFNLAKEKGYEFKNLQAFYKKVRGIIPNEKPSLIHGDLWSGNYLKTDRGFALIDPAVAYSLREMDLAMMKLFGGFPKEAFAAYEANFSLAKAYTSRIELFQLYYLLVHLNLFGSGYLAGVRRCINNYL